MLDVTENPKNLKLVELEAPQLPRSLDDQQIALAVINTTYASQIGLTPAKDGLFVEDKDSPTSTCWLRAKITKMRKT